METIFKNKNLQLAAIVCYVAAMLYIAYEVVK